MRPSTLLALVLLIGLPPLPAAEPPLTNRLAGNPSPYLALHAEDPVHWQPWEAETFARARREGKLVFVSSGYFSCHWCHVMQRESFRDAPIAAFLNRNFIPVKIDRQLLPTVDAGLVDFTERTQGRAGWPLNVFLTPEGYPLLGSLYLPAEAFAALLHRLSEQWVAQPGPLTEMARAASQLSAKANLAGNHRIDREPAEVWRVLREQALSRADELQGGFGAEAKFPMAPQLLALLQVYRREPQVELAEFLRLTLTRMADGGLQDQIGGGFFRYTTDPDWHTPHFEKMLYDNALLVRVYLQAAQLLAAPEFLDVARRTLDFVLDQLQAPGGGYCAALSAVDAEGVEGGAYLWERAEVEQLAGPHWPWVRRYWGLEGAAPFEAGYLLVPRVSTSQLASESGRPVGEVEAALASVREHLLLRRALRRIPKDTQALAGWNGLLLWALADAVEIVEGGRTEGRYGRAAQELQQRLLRQFRVKGELVRARQGARVVSAATLEDYAYVAIGVLRWQAVAGSTTDDAVQAREQLRQWLEQAWQRFYRAGRWRPGEGSDEAGLLRWGRGEVAFADGPMPSPHALLLAASRQTGVQPERTAAVLSAALPQVRAEPFAYASYAALYP